MNRFSGKVFLDGNCCPGNKIRLVSEIDIDELVVLVEIWGNVEDRGRIERDIGAAGVDSAVKKNILIEIISGVSTLKHRKYVFSVI